MVRHALYQLLLHLLLLLGLPWWLSRYVASGRYAGTWGMRFGWLPEAVWQAARNREVIWVHAVSVGEAMAARALVEGLRQAYPEACLLMTTVTPTGQRIVREKITGVDAAFFLPLDLFWVVGRVVDRLHPRLVVVMETEFWPGLYHALKQRGIPLMVVNGRLSERSTRGYRRVRGFMKAVLSAVTRFAVQTDRDREGLLSLGVEPDRITVTGNIKYDQAMKRPDAAEMAGLTERLGPRPPGLIWMAASTHPGEEASVARVYLRLRREWPALRLILAPRHPERVGEVEALFSALGVEGVQRLSMATGGWEGPVLLVDQVGWLTRLYSWADGVFVGGSLVNKGGQNMLEPAAWSIAPLFGPHTGNFREVVEALLRGEGGFRVADEEALWRMSRELLADEPRRQRDGAAARRVVEANQGALQRTLDCLRRSLERP
ncbi:MAG: 3-deoxy-D-manno-octulosonic acid transferase [Magnetococcales bacterium]|nr:3-deoxy-D-manno-octulosonic acid transferase [Magnetococcales bacterium]